MIPYCIVTFWKSHVQRKPANSYDNGCRLRNWRSGKWPPRWGKSARRMIPICADWKSCVHAWPPKRRTAKSCRSASTESTPCFWNGGATSTRQCGCAVCSARRRIRCCVNIASWQNLMPCNSNMTVLCSRANLQADFYQIFWKLLKTGERIEFY